LYENLDTISPCKAIIFLFIFCNTKMKILTDVVSTTTNSLTSFSLFSSYWFDRGKRAIKFWKCKKKLVDTNFNNQMIILGVNG